MESVECLLWLRFSQGLVRLRKQQILLEEIKLPTKSWSGWIELPCFANWPKFASVAQQMVDIIRQLSCRIAGFFFQLTADCWKMVVWGKNKTSFVFVFLVVKSCLKKLFVCFLLTFFVIKLLQIKNKWITETIFEANEREENRETGSWVPDHSVSFLCWPHGSEKLKWCHSTRQNSNTRLNADSSTWIHRFQVESKPRRFLSLTEWAREEAWVKVLLCN